MSLQVLGAHILVKPFAKEEKTTGGIIVPQTASEGKLVKGSVVSVGPGEWDHGIFVKVEGLTEGDTVLLDKNFTTELSNGNEKFLIVRVRDVLAKEV